MIPRMLKGPGDFSPPDPPDLYCEVIECDHYDWETGGCELCKCPEQCAVETEEDAYWGNLYLKYPEM